MIAILAATSIMCYNIIVRSMTGIAVSPELNSYDKDSGGLVSSRSPQINSFMEDSGSLVSPQSLEINSSE